MTKRHDPRQVAHLRSTRDHAGATGPAHAGKLPPSRRRGHRDAAKWTTIAAAAALVVGTVTLAVLLNRNDDGSASSPGATEQPVITGAALPRFDPQISTDSAAGMAAPSVAGYDLAGGTVVIDPATTGQPVLLVFVANWCPHCHRLLPNIQAWLADGTISIDVVIIPTAESASAPSSVSWLADLGWSGGVLADGLSGDGQPGPVALDYGAPGWPYLVLVDSEGRVAARSSGELTQIQMSALLATLG